MWSKLPKGIRGEIISHLPIKTLTSLGWLNILQISQTSKTLGRSAVLPILMKNIEICVLYKNVEDEALNVWMVNRFNGKKYFMGYVDLFYENYRGNQILHGHEKFIKSYLRYNAKQKLSSDKSLIICLDCFDLIPDEKSHDLKIDINTWISFAYLMGCLHPKLKN